ncbi:thymidine phosphorylase [Actibacterium mucosum KCTC 23349]|uniref:Thymidine phosphorylase n=1 Tax=Actibacterium mucosum KCTC 23349 TaxID=1454373 RepID=A0A037ZI25_9RHOB|nr:thymidine phosphorylase [Actibacterium mucosum]KAJ55207.1 thymidine phosphorylase [Actibacterium mucosum KCTC 23349]
MDTRQIIAAKRDGKALPDAAIRDFAAGLADGRVSDAQAGAFAMAVLLNGMSEGERVALTTAMRDSGAVMAWDVPGPVLDKHSTGGVGDCVSLVLAPALAACGAYVPMISGRGLGHTGGTLDKLEAIPGLRAELPTDRLQDLVGRIGCAIVSASSDVAPADKRLYAIRDVTGTVESVPLITASILSKKLAEGLGGLVLDVKVGSGAFMTDMAQARDLAAALVGTARGAGCPTQALITDMDQPLVPSAGNALEVIEVMQVLTGDPGGQALAELCRALGGTLLHLGGLADSVQDGASKIGQAVQSGAAAEIFGDMVAELGGPMDFVENWRDRLPAARVMRPVMAGQAGVVEAIDGQSLGMSVVGLGGGRLRDGDKIDPSVGLSGLLPLGEVVAPDTPLAMVHAADGDAAAKAEAAVRAAYTVGDTHPAIPPLIRERIT